VDAALSLAPPTTHDIAARSRIALCYLWRHGRLPDLDDPQTFTEFVQYGKLHDRNLHMVAFADKIAAKAMVAERLGDRWVTPTLWMGEFLPATPVWPLPFVVKAHHGCNQNAFVRTGCEDWAAIRRAAHRWVRRDYAGVWLDEWLYRHLPRGLLVEPFIGSGGQLPIDYKFYVFAGRAEYVQVHLDRERAHRWMLFDRCWRQVSTRHGDTPPLPASLSHLIEAAEALGRQFDFVRVDLYETDGTPRFGEMTFYPGSGLDPFDPPRLDAEIGAHWARARREPSSRPPSLSP